MFYVFIIIVLPLKKIIIYPLDIEEEENRTTQRL